MIMDVYMYMFIGKKKAVQKLLLIYLNAFLMF